MPWNGRKNKTLQDRQPAGQRDRVRDWDRRKSFMADHKPANSKDWRAFRASS